MLPSQHVLLTPKLGVTFAPDYFMSPSRQTGPWRLGRRIGRGGQGEVFEATRVDEEGGPICAVKQIRTSSPKKAARFKAEVANHVELSARQAPNIMPILDHSIEEDPDGRVSGYIAMPRAECSLDEVSDTSRGRLDLCLDVFIGIVAGIGAAHEAGIIHRDIKPANILFMDRSLRTPLISDFGICLLRDTPKEKRITEVHETVGARFFMAPEQERGGVVDVRESADVYALGKLLHFMLTGRHLHREHLNEAFTDGELREDPRLREVLRLLLERTIVEDPSQRIPDGSELLAAATSLRDSVRTMTSPSPERSGASDGTGFRASYDRFTELLSNGGTKNVELQFDHFRRQFEGAWADVHADVKDRPDGAAEASRRLIALQQETVACALAMARCDAIELFVGFKRHLELAIKTAGETAGYTKTAGIPNMYAGFLYISTSVMALRHESWELLADLLTARFETRCGGERAMHVYGFAYSQFFHHDALERAAAKCHDLYRKMLASEDISVVTTLRGDELLDSYVQTQMLMCLRGAQLLEHGESPRMWPDFGRFYGHRAIGLLDRMHGEPDYAAGVCKSFGESAEEFLGRLNGRLELIQSSFWGGSSYSWDSISSWEPR